MIKWWLRCADDDNDDRKDEHDDDDKNYTKKKRTMQNVNVNLQNDSFFPYTSSSILK